MTKDFEVEDALVSLLSNISNVFSNKIMSVVLTLLLYITINVFLFKNELYRFVLFLKKGIHEISS